jgi:hypothetical protein
MTDLAAFLWNLELAAAEGATATRPTRYKARCPVCKQRFTVIEARVPILTSAGTVDVWQDRRPHTHSPACHQTYTQPTDREPIDLWA